MDIEFCVIVHFSLFIAHLMCYLVNTENAFPEGSEKQTDKALNGDNR